MINKTSEVIIKSNDNSNLVRIVSLSLLWMGFLGFIATRWFNKKFRNRNIKISPDSG